MTSPVPDEPAGTQNPDEAQSDLETGASSTQRPWRAIELAAQAAAHTGSTADRPELDDDEDAADRESVLVAPPTLGRPVDPPDEPRQAFGLGSTRTPKRPIVPPWLRSREDFAIATRWALRDGAYVTGYHATRLPKYTAKMAVFAPVGLVHTISKILYWATAEEGNWALRQLAASRNDADTWLKLDRQRQRQARSRWWIVVLGLVAAVAGVIVFTYADLAWWERLAVGAVVVPALARAGRPADRPITDRVSEGPKYRKLTAEMVRRALIRLGLKDINQAVAQDPGAITFPMEIHRDGPGHMAIVDLPEGVDAAMVVARRSRLASALRLPMDQVWPDIDRDAHPGRLNLWVGMEPSSRMRKPEWPLLRAGQVDVFAEIPFLIDPRLRIVMAQIIARNWLFGGQPGSGKTFALRLLVLACALDPRVEIRGYELKGVGDFKPLAPVCAEYGNGFDDETICRAAAMFDWLKTELLRRSKRIDFYAAKGMAPENKVTPELASLTGSGLHPLVVFVDEVQNLFQHKKVGKDAGEVAEECIKLGRALGVTLLLGTQIPDKASLPTGITRNINSRMCLSVLDQVANDMILGTSMYQNGYRATVFEPGVDAGWGIVVGLGKPQPLCSMYVDNDDAARIIERAIALRQAAGTLPEAPEIRDAVPSFDVLADCLAIWPAGEDAAWNETLIEQLVELRPEIYDGWKQAQLTAALSGFGVKVDQIGRRIDGKSVTRRGPKYADLVDAKARRERRAAEPETLGTAR